MTLFQSTLPREERHCLIVKTSLYSYFNPRSHERSDKSTYNSFCPRLLISIHAPTRGATRSRFFVTIKVDFNPRSHERSDPKMPFHSCPYHDFNPRSHERSDMNCHNWAAQIVNFNPRSHERSDLFLISILTK